MSRTPDNLLDYMYDLLDSRIARIQETMLDGAPKDYAAYRELVGRADAYRSLREELKDVERRLQQA